MKNNKNLWVASNPEMRELIALELIHQNPRCAVHYDGAPHVIIWDQDDAAWCAAGIDETRAWIEQQLYTGND